MDLLKIPENTYRNIGPDWNQFPVYTKREIIRVIETHLGFRHLGISVCAYSNGDQILLFLPFDFDSTELRQPWEEAKRLFNRLVDMDITCILQNSGRKGFHVIIETEPKVYHRSQIASAHEFFRDIDGLETFDPKLIGDVSRLIRIGWTFHPDGTWCRVIAEHNGQLLDLDDLPIEYDPYDYDRHNENEYGNKVIERPCIEELIKDKEYWHKHHPRGTFEPSEDVRLTWASMRLWRGDTFDEIISEAESYGWDDFDEDKIRKKLEYLDSKEWTPHSCDKLKSYGYCLPHIRCKWKRIEKEDLEALGIVNGRMI